MSQAPSPPDPLPIVATPPGAATEGGPHGVDIELEPAIARSERTPLCSAHLAVPSVVAGAADRFKQHKHIPLVCPSCGFQGRAKIAMLGRTFYCKQCGKEFYVTVRGTVRGTRPAAENIVNPDAPVKLDKPNWLEVWFSRLTLSARWVVLACAVAALGCLALLLRTTRAAPLPRDLPERARVAGRALALGDLRLLDRMTMSTNNEALHQWYETVRPKEFSGLTAESQVRVTVGELVKQFRRAEIVPGKKKKVPVADFDTPLEIFLPPPRRHADRRRNPPALGKGERRLADRRRLATRQPAGHQVRPAAAGCFNRSRRRHTGRLRAREHAAQDSLRKKKKVPRPNPAEG